jgi:tetratricopeptide (TPR) repeat protein
MRQLRTISSLLVLAFAGAVVATAQTPPDKVFEMPGVFRIALPQGWQRSRVIDDRATVAAFSSKDLTLEVTRELANFSAEGYVQTISGLQRPDWDEYPGKYTPAEVASDPQYSKDYKSDFADRFDEYTLIGGLPALWVRYRVVYTKAPAEVRASRAWTVFVLSPGEYWSLQLRGDERAWPASDSDLLRMVRSFQFLEPMQARVKAAIPAEAWKRVPSNLPEGSCQFAGTASGVSVVVPCETKVKLRWEGAADKYGIVGKDTLKLGEADLVFLHYVADWSAEKFSRQTDEIFAERMKEQKIAGHEGSYKQNDKREVSVDGTPGTSITATVIYKKAREEGLRRLLTVSKGTDHFYISCAYTKNNSDQVTRIFDSIQIFALHPQLTPVSSNYDPEGADGKPAAPTADQLKRLREDVRLLNNSVSHYRLGKALDVSGDHAAAFNEFATAVQLNPGNGDADMEVGRVYAAQNDLTDAIAAYQRALFYSQMNYTEASTQLATLYAKSGNSLFALFHLDNAGEGAPAIMLPEDEIAPSRKALEEYAKQREAAEKIESEATGAQDLQDMLGLAELVMKYGDFASANIYCRSVHVVDRRNVRALACLARTAEARGEHEAAVSNALEWLVQSPNNPEAYFWLARGYAVPPADFVNAAESYEAVIRNAGQGQIAPAMLQQARATLPVCYQQLQDWQGAAAAFDSAVRESPSDVQLLNNASWFYSTTESKLRDPAKALEYANRALAIAPQDPNIMDTLAEAYFANGRIEDAIATEQKALAQAPDRADLQKQMEKFKQAQQSKKTPQPHKK